MFDTYVMRQSEPQSQTHRHVITEKRAPTDESVRLLKEMEQTARDKFLGSIRLENCPIDCVVHARRDDARLDVNFIVQLKINSKNIEINHTHKGSFSAGSDNQYQAAIDGLRDCVAKRIASELLAEAFSNAEDWAKGVFR
jgi:hypothetical protein